MRRIFRDKVYGTADGIAVLIRHECLADLDCLNHIGRYEVELHVTDVALCRRQPRTVDSNRTELRRSATYLTETRLALVILHVYAAYTFQRVSDIRVRELAYLVGRYHIRDIDIVFLCIYRSLLPGENTGYHHFVQLPRCIRHHNIVDSRFFRYCYRFVHGEKSDIGYLKTVVA